jgi:hypothetical protein
MVKLSEDSAKDAEPLKGKIRFPLSVRARLQKKRDEIGKAVLHQSSEP